METLFQQLLKEKTYLGNVSPHTLRSYRAAFDKFKLYGGLTKSGVSQFVVGMREAGLSPGACNVHIRAVNSFLSWLHENGHTSEHLKAKQLKEEKKVIQTFSEAHLRAIVAYRPKNFFERRLHAILCLLIDTGVRIEEALTLKVSSVDFENLLITVNGKGQKERVVPMGPELRKKLYLYLKKVPVKSEYLFPVQSGWKMEYHNFRRDMINLCTKLGIKGVRISPQTLRHTFAVNYVRSGGNLFYLQKALGHTTLQMTRRYCELQTEDLKQMHSKVSILGRMK